MKKKYVVTKRTDAPPGRRVFTLSNAPGTGQVELLIEGQRSRHTSASSARVAAERAAQAILMGRSNRRVLGTATEEDKRRWVEYIIIDKSRPGRRQVITERYGDVVHGYVQGFATKHEGAGGYTDPMVNVMPGISKELTARDQAKPTVKYTPLNPEYDELPSPHGPRVNAGNSSQYCDPKHAAPVHMCKISKLAPDPLKLDTLVQRKQRAREITFSRLFVPHKRKDRDLRALTTASLSVAPDIWRVGLAPCTSAANVFCVNMDSEVKFARVELHRPPVTIMVDDAALTDYVFTARDFLTRSNMVLQNHDTKAPLWLKQAVGIVRSE